MELLSAFHRAYHALRLKGKIVVTDINPLAPSFLAADSTYEVPPFTDPEYVPTLLEIVKRSRVKLVFPLIDPDIPILAAHKQDFESLGAKVMTPDAEGAETARDKWQTHRMFETLGIPAARSWLPEDLRKEKPGFPLFIKPRRGSAGQGAFRVEDERQLEFFLTYVEDPIIQECLPGPEITSDVVCNAAGEVWAVVSRRRIEIRAGEVAKGVTVWDETIARSLHAPRQRASAPPARSPCSASCAMENRFSPRSTRASAAAARWASRRA